MLTAPSRAGAKSRLFLSTLVVVLLVLGLASAPTAADSVTDPPVPEAELDPTKDRPELPKRCSEGSHYINPEVRPCIIGRFKRSRPTLVLWGDSHALQMLPAVQAATKGRGVNLLMMSIGGCPALKYRHTPGQDPASCAGFNADALTVVAHLKKWRAPVRVIIGNYWYGYALLHESFKNGTAKIADHPDHVVEATRVFHRRGPGLLRQLRRMEVPVDLIGHTATARGTLAPCAEGEEPYMCDIPRHLAIPHARANGKWLASLVEPFGKRSRVIDTSAAYCTATVCHGFKDGMYTFFDDKHLSATRASTLGRFFVPSVKRLKWG